jgi:ORF 12 gene product N-terminal
MTRRWLRTAVTVCAALLWAGCASTNATAPSDPSAAIATTTTASVDDASEAAVFPMDDHIGWLIGVLDAGQFDPAEASERFDTAFLAQVPVAALNAPLGQIAAAGSAPWRVLGAHREDRVAEITVESANGTRLTITLALAGTQPYQIESLLLQPADTEQPEGYTFTQLDADVAAFAPRGALGIYDVTQAAGEGPSRRVRNM